MALSIVLLSGTEPYHSPGSTVSGRVELNTRNQQYIQSIGVTFTGSCEVGITKPIRNMNSADTETSTSRGCYFSHRLVLYRGDQMYDAGTHTWPFTFTIPKEGGRSCQCGPSAKCGTFGPTAPWRGSNVSERHTLPPTFSYSFKGTRHKESFECAVGYMLYARLTRKSNCPVLSRDLLATRAVTVRALPLPALVLGLPPPYQHHQIHYQDYSIKSNLASSSLSERAKGVLRGLAGPDARIRLKIVVPRVLEANALRTIPLLVSASMASQSSPNYDSGRNGPIVLHLKHLEFILSIHTHARAGSQRIHDTANLCLAKGSGIDIHVSVHGASDQKDGTRQQDFPETDLGEAFDLRLMSDKLVPEFSTYNIYRTYAIQLKLRLENAGQKLLCVFEDLPVQISTEMTLPIGAEHTRQGDSREIGLDVNLGSDANSSNEAVPGEPPSYQP